MKMKHLVTIGNHRTQSFGFRCVFLFESSAKTRALSLSIQFPPIIISTNCWRGVTKTGRCKRPETDCLRSSTCKMSWTECIFVHKRNLRLCMCMCWCASQCLTVQWRWSWIASWKCARQQAPYVGCASIKPSSWDKWNRIGRHLLMCVWLRE